MSYWNSWSDFLAMGGYALYVWGSVLMTIAVLAGEVVAVRLRRRSQLEMQRLWSRHTQRESNENET